MIVGEGSGFRGGTGAAAERGGAPKYDPIVVSAESTVVSEYEGEASSDTGYQSEAELEASFIHLLESQAYEYLPITSEAEADCQPASATGEGQRHDVLRRGMGEVLLKLCR